MTGDGWDPDQYHRFAAERRAPFDDLLDLVAPVPDGRVLDLGCGPGELTADLARRLRASEVVGIDSSAAMLEQAAAHAGDGLRFEQGDIGELEATDVDVIFSNAALQWLADHEAALARWTAALAPDGQLAVQVPANGDHPSHTVAAAVAAEAPYAEHLGDERPHTGQYVLDPEEYARILYRLGFAHRHVRLQVYGHEMASSSEVVEWMRGTALTPVRRLLPPELYDEFVTHYRERLLDQIGTDSPYLFTFKRILFWGRR